MITLILRTQAISSFISFLLSLFVKQAGVNFPLLVFKKKNQRFLLVFRMLEIAAELIKRWLHANHSQNSKKYSIDIEVLKFIDIIKSNIILFEAKPLDIYNLNETHFLLSHNSTSRHICEAGT